MEETAHLAVEAMQEWGKLFFLGKDGQPAEHYTISKNTVVLGRDKNCDIVIPRREVSRQHARLAVDHSGAVWVSSMGKEPVCVNGQPAHDAVELYSGDQIEILLEGRTKIICFEAAQEDTIKINKNPSTGRVPLGEADTNTGDCTLREGTLAAAAVAQKTPRSAARPPLVTRSAATPPAPPPMPAKGSLFAGSAVSAALKAAPPKPPPVPCSRIPAAPHQPVEAAGASAPVVAQKPARAPRAPAPGPFLPSAVDLQALRAGLRKTSGIADGATAEPPCAAAEPAKPTRDARAMAKKRKSVRFNIPPQEPASPEGVAADATAHWGAAVAQSPDVIINVSADSTAAFSAWAMGTRAPRCSLADLTGDGLGLPSIQEETGSEDCASPDDEDMCMQQVTPSRQITPAIRRRSSVMSSAKRGTALPASPESVARKRRSCSGSRNGTPAVRDRRSVSVGAEVTAMLAEDSALDASLAAAEAAAAHAEKTDGAVTLNLAAAAHMLEAMVTKQPEDGQVAVTPPPTADVAPGDLGTPWTKEIEHEASAFAKLLAAASRSVTPSSPQGTPQRPNTMSRAHTPASGRKSRFSLPAGSAVEATAGQEPGSEPHAPANTPNAAPDAHDAPGLQLPGPSPMDIAEAAVQQMTSDQPADASGDATDEELDDVDVALDSALEAFPEEELVRRDQILSLMANFKTALARAKEGETRARELEGLLGEAENLVNTLQRENAEIKCQLAAMQSCTPALDTTQSSGPLGSEVGGRGATETQSAALQPQDPAAPLVSELAMSEPAAEGAANLVHAAAPVPVLQRSPDHLLALAGCLQWPAQARRCTSDAGLLPGGPARQQGAAAHAARRRSESGAPRSAARLPLAARTCLLRAQDALLAALPAQRDSTAALASAAAMTLPGGSAQDADSPAGQGSAPAAAQPEVTAAAVVEESMLPPLPFEGLSQRLSQGTCEWMEGILMKTGSQDISPPKDIDDAAQPAQQAKSDPAPCGSPGGATPEEAQPEVTTGLAAMPTQEATAEPIAQAIGTTEGAAPKPEAVLAHPLDIGSPAAPQPVLDASQEPAEEAELDAAVAMAEPDVAADGAPMEAVAEEDEEDEDRCCMCDEAEEGDVLLLCDGCDSAFHLQCAKPRLRRIPAGDWHCHECRAAKKAAAKGPKPATSTEAVLSGPEAEPKTTDKPARRSARTGSSLPELAAEEAPVSKRATRRTSIAPSADEAAEASGAARRRRSVAPAQTPAAAAAPAGGAAPTTAVSMRGGRRRSSVSPIPDSITKEVQDGGRATRGARRVPAASVTELSLGPPQGSLGVIMEEGSEEAGSEADEGQSAPQAESSLPSAAQDAAPRGKKRVRAAAKTDADGSAKAAKRTRAGKSQAAPQTRRSTRASSRS